MSVESDGAERAIRRQSAFSTQIEEHIPDLGKLANFRWLCCISSRASFGVAGRGAS
jgi:hypothetical protein